MAHERDSFQWILRNGSTEPNVVPWGLHIYRCTYSSTTDEEWSRYISMIRKDAYECLKELDEKDLLDTMEWTVVEDPTLDGVTWQEARDRFDERLRNELLALEKPYQSFIESVPGGIDTFWTPKGKINSYIHLKPSHEFFLFADEASVRSVIDRPEESNVINSKFNFLTLVKNGLQDNGMEAHSDLLEEMGESREDEDEETPDDDDEQYWRDLRKMVQAWDLVKVYATIKAGGWQDDFVDWEHGIYEVVQF